jgi:hypothetical protein
MIWGIGIVLLLGLGITGAVLVTARSLPSYDKLKSSQAGQMIVVRANDGSEIVTLGPSYGKWIPYNRIPQPMKDALVSVEDRRFREHWGVDPVGIIRSVMVRAQSGRWRQGGSTITQQLARNIFLNNSRTFDRKIREAILSLALESKFSKDQISNSISTRSTSAAAPMAWIPPRASSSAIRASSFRWARRRSSPAWSRRLRTIRPRPMPRPPWTAPRWCWKPWSMPAR